jgi:hypothetical protein
MPAERQRNYSTVTCLFNFHRVIHMYVLTMHTSVLPQAEQPQLPGTRGCAAP